MVSIRADARRAGLLDVLAGQTVEYVRLGHATVLGLPGGCQVIIETSACLNARVVDPGDQAYATLLGNVIQAGWTDQGGRLRILFDGGLELLVGADAEFESWAITGRGGQLIVCLARGEVAFWGDSGSTDPGAGLPRILEPPSGADSIR